jgi:MscS family membrane protein
METFLDAMQATRDGDTQRIEKAVATLDLSEINPMVRAEKGREAAWLLLEVIDRTRVPDTRHFATRTRGKPFVFHTYTSGSIEIQYTDGAGWRFSAATVAALPDMLDEVSE